MFSKMAMEEPALIKRATAYRSDLTDLVPGGIMFTNVRRA